MTSGSSGFAIGIACGSKARTVAPRSSRPWMMSIDGRIAHVVGLGLEREPEHAHGLALRVAAERLDDLLDHALALALRSRG